MRSLRLALTAATAAGLALTALAPAADAKRPFPHPAQTPVTVQLLSITDFHSGNPMPWQEAGLVLKKADGTQIVPGDTQYLKAHLDRLRAQNPRTITFSNGDNFTAYNYADKASNYEYGLDAYNRLGMEFTAVGNHDIDWNIDYLRQHYSAQACQNVGKDDCFLDAEGKLYDGVPGPSLSANLTWTKDGSLVYKPYLIKTFKQRRGPAIKVGIIGATLKGAETWPMSWNEKITITDPLAAVDKYANELHAKGVNAIVVSLHDGGTNSSPTPLDACGDLGGPAVDVARKASPLVDGVIAGHSHKVANCQVNDPAGNPRFYSVGGSYGNLINQMNLSIRPSDGEVIRSQSSNTLVPVTTDIAPDQKMIALQQHWDSFMADRANSIVAHGTGALPLDRDASGEHHVGNLQADAFVWSGSADARTRADLALVTTTGSDDWDRNQHGAIGLTADGGIRHEDAFSATGRDMKIVTVTMTGEAIKKSLEQQWATGEFRPLAVSAGVHYAFDPAAPQGAKVRDLTLHGKAIEPTATYRVAMTSEDMLNSGNRFGVKALQESTDPATHMQLDNKTFVSYLRHLGTVNPPALDRVDVVQG